MEKTVAIPAKYFHVLIGIANRADRILELRDMGLTNGEQWDTALAALEERLMLMSELEPKVNQ